MDVTAKNAITKQAVITAVINGILTTTVAYFMFRSEQGVVALRDSKTMIDFYLQSFIACSVAVMVPTGKLTKLLAAGKIKRLESDYSMPLPAIKLPGPLFVWSHLVGLILALILGSIVSAVIMLIPITTVVFNSFLTIKFVYAFVVTLFVARAAGTKALRTQARLA